MSDNLVLVLCFAGTIIGILLIALWSIRDTERQYREHREKMDEIYRRHG